MPAAEGALPAIAVHDLHKRYGAVQAVDGVSFDVWPAEVFGLLGPNGAGKTTTVEIIEGLRTPDSGAVRVLNVDVAARPRDVKERIGVQLQAPALLPRLRVQEIIELFAGFYAAPRPVDEVIALADLGEVRDRRAGVLSGGQAQRLSLALALINRPEVVFLDEPTTGLDPQARANLWDVIGRLRDAGTTLLLTTHSMEEAERLCDRVAIIDQGRVVALDRPRALIAAHFTETAIQFRMAGVADEELRGLAGVGAVARDVDDVTLYSADVPATMAGLLALSRNGARLLENLSVRGATLEDVFLKLTGRRLRE